MFREVMRSMQTNRFTFAMATLSVLFLGDQTRAERPYFTLPDSLQMETDEEYGSWEGYKPLEPLSGSYIYGRKTGFVRISEHLDVKKIDNKCGNRVSVSGNEQQADLDWEGPDALVWPASEFWLYRYNGNVVYISRWMVATGITGCKLELNPEFKVTRGFIIGNRLNTSKTGFRGEVKFQTELIDGSFLTEIPSHLLRDATAGVKFTKRFGWRRVNPKNILGRPSLGVLSEKCFVHGRLDASTQCYINTRGPLYGRRSFMQSYQHSPQSVWNEKIHIAEPHARLDSRIFEWDRELSLRN